MKTRTSIYHRTFAFAYVLLVAVIFCGCEDRPPMQTEARGTDARNYQTIVIDSCEYLIRQSGHAGFMSHKGNCKFCTERSKK
jgi:hypothetical protein